MSDVTGRREWSSPDPLAVVAGAWHVIIAASIVVGALGALTAITQEPTYQATAVVVVEDSRSQVLQRASTDIERYVASQAAVVRSEPVAAAASETLAEMGLDLPPDALLDGLAVSVEEGTDIVSIRLRTDDRETAQEGATAVARAYADLVRSSIRTELETSRDRLDEQIALAMQDLADARLRVAALRSAATANVDDVVDAAAETLTTPDDAAEDEAAAAVVDELAALEALAEFEERDPELAGALRVQQDLEFVVRDLSERRAELTADISLVGSGVAFITDAGPGRASRFSTSAAVLLGAVLGGGIGLALAYLHAAGAGPLDRAGLQLVPETTTRRSAAEVTTPDDADEDVTRSTDGARRGSSDDGGAPAVVGEFAARAPRSRAEPIRAARELVKAAVARQPEDTGARPAPPVLATATTHDDGAVASIELAVLEVMIALLDDVFEVPPAPPIVTAIVTRDVASVALELGRRLSQEMSLDGRVLLLELTTDGTAARNGSTNGAWADTGRRDGAPMPDVVQLAGAHDVSEALAAVDLDGYADVLAVLSLDESDADGVLDLLHPHKAVVVSALGHEADVASCWEQVDATAAHRVGTVVVDDHPAPSTT